MDRCRSRAKFEVTHMKRAVNVQLTTLDSLNTLSWLNLKKTEGTVLYEFRHTVQALPICLKQEADKIQNLSKNISGF